MQKSLFILFYLISIQVAFSQIYTPQIDSVIMTDGKKLAVDVYKLNDGVQRPTILIQTPYNRIYYRWGLPIGIGANLSTSGFNFVIADWRGFYGSAGAMVASPNRGKDGYDLVEWIALQSWSDGKVGTWGPSALGKIQFQTAKENPPHLVCCVPLVSGSQFDYSEYYPGGVYRTEYVQQLDALGYGMSTFLLANPFYNITWQYIASINYYPASIQVPCFMIGGWYDHNIEVMLDLFAGIRQLSPTSVKSKHKLMMGPWAHGGFGAAQVGTCMQGELTFNEACGWSDSLALRCLNYYLKNQANGWESEPVIQYFQIGDNIWKETINWPPTGYTNQNLYMQSGGQLTSVLPVSLSSKTTITYDPSDPSPTHGGSTLRQDQLQGPYDQSQVVETRNDIAIFSTPTLTSPIQIVGKPLVHLFVKSNRKDTDFTVRFCDVYPDGRSMIISDGILRMRFRNGFTTADTASMVPGQIYNAEIELPNTAYTFLPGHAIRMDITSSNYPRYNNNLNNGGAMYVVGDTLIANNEIYHENSYASFITLPVSNNSVVEEISIINNVKIFPNPVSNFISFEWNGSYKYLQVAIFNDLGIIVKSQRINESEVMDVSDITTGIYLLKCLYDDKVMDVKKIMISGRNR